MIKYIKVKYMKIKWKRILLLLGIILVIAGVLYKIMTSITYKETKLIYDKKDLRVNVGNTYNTKEFFKVKKGEFITKEIKFNKLGKQTIKVEYYIKPYKYYAEKTFDVYDLEAPKIFSTTSFSVEEGTTKEALINKVISADNYDPKPKRMFKGNIDLNKPGTYNLTYVIEDKSGNKTERPSKITVLKKKPKCPSCKVPTFKPEGIAFDKIYEELKTKDNEIGIDVSKWQKDIDFKKVKEAGASFVMIRLGTQKGFKGELLLDQYFERNYKEARKHGLKVGVYFYSYALNNNDAKAQAAFVIKNLKGKNIDMPVAFDWEDFRFFPRIELSINTLNDLRDTFLKEIKDSGYDAYNYSSKYYLNNIWKASSYPVWLAHYTLKTDYKGPYYMHQITHQGVIKGIDGFIDINVYYKKGMNNGRQTKNR